METGKYGDFLMTKAPLFLLLLTAFLGCSKDLNQQRKAPPTPVSTAIPSNESAPIGVFRDSSATTQKISELLKRDSQQVPGFVVAQLSCWISLAREVLHSHGPFSAIESSANELLNNSQFKRYPIYVLDVYNILAEAGMSYSYSIAAHYYKKVLSMESSDPTFSRAALLKASAALMLVNIYYKIELISDVLSPFADEKKAHQMAIGL
ncbi:MAG: hypothetical protein ACP5JH_07575 [Bacteroidota bacterium]